MNKKKNDKVNCAERICKNCRYFSVGHIDQGSNWMNCEKGHRLIPEKDLTEKHHLNYDPNEKLVQLTV